MAATTKLISSRGNSGQRPSSRCHEKTNNAIVVPALKSEEAKMAGVKRPVFTGIDGQEAFFSAV